MAFYAKLFSFRGYAPFPLTRGIGKGVFTIGPRPPPLVQLRLV